MSASWKSNARSSASTPSIEPPPRSEHELLKLRENQAKAALSATFQELGRNLKNLVDLKPTIREHPWKSGGIAALLGFAVALKFVPSQGREKEEDASPETENPSAPSPWASLTSALVETGSGAFKAALMPWLAQKLQDLMPQNEAAAEEPGAEEVPFSP